jgi:hypothetical protein
MKNDTKLLPILLENILEWFTVWGWMALALGMVIAAIVVAIMARRKS